jgi:hypothetical protein
MTDLQAWLSGRYLDALRALIEASRHARPGSAADDLTKIIERPLACTGGIGTPDR